MTKIFRIRNLTIILVLFLAIWVLFYEKDRRWLKQIQEIGFLFPSGGNMEAADNGGQKQFELTRDYLMSYIASNISKLSPLQPSSERSWSVGRFWFATNRDLYAEYGDGKASRQILVSVEGDKEPLNYKITGYFEPGENGWKLKIGEDTMFGRKLDLYEYDEESKKWVKKN